MIDPADTSSSRMSDIQGLAVQRTGDLDVTADAGHWLDMLFQEHRLSPAHRRIARFLLEHPDEAAHLAGR